MAKRKSAKKPTKKAVTRSRSTTSSTTAPKRPGTKGKIPEPETTTEPALLSNDQQTAVLALLQRGASPAGAMQQLGLSIDVFLRTAIKNAEFHERTIEVTDVLSGNVKAVLYRTAMEGNVSAQQAWLKLFPSRIDNREPPTPATFDEILETLTDDQLVELARAMGVDLPHETKDHA